MYNERNAPFKDEPWKDVEAPTFDLTEEQIKEKEEKENSEALEIFENAKLEFDIRFKIRKVN